MVGVIRPLRSKSSRTENSVARRRLRRRTKQAKWCNRRARLHDEWRGVGPGTETGPSPQIGVEYWVRVSDYPIARYHSQMLLSGAMTV